MLLIKPPQGQTADLKGAIKSVGHKNMQRGGKRSATSLWMGAEPVIRRKSGVALRLPPHSIESRDMSDSFPQPETGRVSSQFFNVRR